MPTARQIAEQRLASGEIDEFEFDRIIRQIRPDISPENVMFEPSQNNSSLGPNDTRILKGGFVGFWKRLAAGIVDTLLILLVTLPVLLVVYGSAYWESDALVYGWFDFLVSYVFPIVFTIYCWKIYQATPGKYLVSAAVVDAESGLSPSTSRLTLRYFAYFISLVPFGLGFLWIVFDKRKQGWHDKIARTVVVNKKR